MSLGEVRVEFGDQVGRVVGVHLLQHVGCPLGVQRRDHVHLLVLGQLLQRLGQPVVVHRLDDRRAQHGIHVVELARDVGRLQLGQPHR